MFGRDVPVAVDGVLVETSTVRALLGSNDDLGLAAADLAESVERVGATTVATSSAADLAAGATRRVEQGAGSVASAAEQMSAAMREVAASAARATGVTAEAGVVTTEVLASVERLTTSSAEIGGVVRTVTGISEQTRMLALNATIEAARAGSAGRGFAVVAEEVKNLAALTGEATVQIGEQLAALHADTDDVRRAAQRIDEVLSRVGEFQETIAAAVEEQTAAIAEITRAAAEAAAAAGDLEASVGTTAGAAREAAAAVERSRTWLVRMATALDRQRAEVESLGASVAVHPLRAAITAHAGWKRSLMAAIETGQAPAGTDVTKAARSDACAFGQWLGRREGEAADDSRATPAADQHAQFHREAATVLRAALDRRVDDARQLIADPDGYAGTAGRLTDLLVAWLAEVEAEAAGR